MKRFVHGISLMAMHVGLCCLAGCGAGGDKPDISAYVGTWKTEPLDKVFREAFGEVGLERTREAGMDPEEVLQLFDGHRYFVVIEPGRIKAGMESDDEIQTILEGDCVYAVDSGMIAFKVADETGVFVVEGDNLLMENELQGRRPRYLVFSRAE